MAAGNADTTARGKVTISFGELVISSDFDSGNIDRVEQVGGGDSLEFNLWTALDCAGTEFENPNSSWFYFKVLTPANHNGKTLSFNIMNMNRQWRLYQQGLTPIMKVGKGNWERMAAKPTIEMVNGQFKLSFQYRISENYRQTVYFAFCYPYSYRECQEKLLQCDEQYSGCDHNIYYHRELLCYSLEGRRVDLITVSSCDGITDEYESRLTGLFPDTSTPRAKRSPGKKVFVLTSRVHPGETPSSFVFNGFLDFILRRDDPRSINLRKNFIFLLIPMINPDGVFKGHFRTDSKGQNLNRYYQNPQLELQPSVYAIYHLLLYHHHQGHVSSSHNLSECLSHDHLQINKNSGIAFYVDLHGHVAKRGCFMYGNYFKNELEQAENMLFPKLVSLNSVYFDFQPCVFSEKNMYAADKRDGLSKEGSGRVALHKATGIIHSYTLECNYNSGRSCNGLSAATCDDGRATPPRAGTAIPCKYTIACYEEVGRGLAVAALDMIGANPWSRLPTSKHCSVHGTRQWILLHISRMRAKELNKKRVNKTTTITTSWKISMATATGNPITTNAAPPVRRASLPHTAAVQSRPQHLPNITQAHKTRVHLHLPSTLPTLAHNKQVISRVRKPAAPACLKEHSSSTEAKTTKKLMKRINSPNTLDKQQHQLMSIDGHKYSSTSDTIVSI